MKSEEEEFFSKLIETFREEAQDHLKALSSGILELESDLAPAKRKEVIETVFREAHSLKGAARAVNQQTIQEICQKFESVLACWKKNPAQAAPEVYDKLHATVDVIKKALTAKLDNDCLNNVLQSLEEISKTIESEKSKGAEEKPRAPIEPFSSDSSVAAEEVSLPIEQKPSVKTTRISVEKMNRLFHEVEETLMIKLFFMQHRADLKQLQTHLRTQEKNLLELSLDIQMLLQALQKEAPHQKNLETIKKAVELLDQQQKEMSISKELMNKLVKDANHHGHFSSSIVDTLLEDSKKILMQPIATLFEYIPLMARDLARDLSKEVRVEFHGRDIEVDRRVLEELKDPITHLIRNAIDHGIETPEERRRCSKPPGGTIRVSASEREGNNVCISISDDGKGFELNKIKDAALKKGLITAKEIQEMSDKEAIKWAFHSEISTSPIITELSGRGIGLGIVSEKVDELGGQVSVESIPGHGTTFSLILPLTLETFRGVHITVMGRDFIIPSHNIKRVIRVKMDEIMRTENKEMIVVEGQCYSFIHLADILGLTKNEHGSGAQDSFFAIILKAAEQTIAFGADSIQSEREILVKGLGTQCTHIKNIMAATLMENGDVVLILNPTDLVHSTIRSEIPTTHLAAIRKDQAAKKLILVVEDSMTTRLLLKNILVSASYEVKTAVDGVEALETLRTQMFDLILTDIDMPRMNGFVLTEKVRSMPQFKDLPIIMCTALGSREDRERGIELGANAYLDKNNLNQQMLLGTIQKLI